MEKLPVGQLPEYVKAAVVLNLAVSSNLFPLDEKEHKVVIEKGTSKTVRISVGKKP